MHCTATHYWKSSLPIREAATGCDGCRALETNGATTTGSPHPAAAYLLPQCLDVTLLRWASTECERFTTSPISLECRLEAGTTDPNEPPSERLLAATNAGPP